MFKPINRSGYFPERIAAEISKKILLGNMLPGDKLPSEHALAKTFHVSRSVIREAIAQLRNEGLLETKQGLGAFVTSPEQRQGIKIELDQLTEIESIQSLFQLRIPLEEEAAGLAAKYRSAKQVKILKQSLDTMQSATSWREQSVPADLLFHRTIAEATNNEYFSMILGLIAQRLSSAIIYARNIYPIQTVIDITITEHAKIIEAIEQKQSDKARQAMRQHILNAGHRFNLSLDVFGTAS